jgi:small subunit ribosomal protein S9
MDNITNEIKINETNGIFTTTGKRKNAVACLRYDNQYSEILINNKPWKEFFPQERHQLKVLTPFKVANIPLLNNLKFKVIGGGVTAQSEAVRHAISKLLKVLYPEMTKSLKEKGLLTRDSRKKEREKPGQRGARAQFNSKKR